MESLRSALGIDVSEADLALGGPVVVFQPRCECGYYPGLVAAHATTIGWDLPARRAGFGLFLWAVSEIAYMQAVIQPGAGS